MRLIVLACVVACIAAQTPGSATCPDNACVQTCTNGFLKDDKGCATCRCACKAVTCSNTCETFAKDQDGCDTCDCAKKTCPTLTSTEKCDYGREVDSDGCETEKCKPPPSICPQVMCLIACEFGMEVDAKTGCPTCQCKRPVCEVCNTFAPCRYGYKYDDKGCQTCDCNDPPPTCSATVTCRLYCEFGYEKDANGCDTCTCAKPVCPAIACATFARCANGFAKDEKTGCDTCQCAPDPTCTRPICTAQWCEFGYKRDPTTKCDTCECAPNPNPCPQIRCANQCKYGNIVDENGCQTCQCVAGPTDCTTVGINSDPTSAAREPCAIRCAYGLQVDSTTKCPICACNPAPPCPLIKCATQCPNGYVYENGCQTCQCITRVDVCTFAASAGSCKAAIDAWAFDTKTRKCSKFTWGGCPDGNSNRFETLAQCEKTCLPPFTVTIKIDAAVTLTSDQADAVTRAIASATGAERVALDSSKAGEVTIFVYDGSLTTKQVEQAVKDDIAKNDSSIKTAAGGQAVTGSTVVGEQVSASPANVAAPVAGVVVALLVALRLL